MVISSLLVRVGLILAVYGNLPDCRTTWELELVDCTWDGTDVLNLPHGGRQMFSPADRMCLCAWRRWCELGHLRSAPSAST